MDSVNRIVSTNLRHLLTVIHDFRSVSAARRTFGPQILIRMLVLIVQNFVEDEICEKKRTRSIPCASERSAHRYRERSRRRRNEKIRATMQKERKQEETTHHENWSTRIESGAIYTGSPLRSLFGFRKARQAQLSSSLFRQTSS